MKMKITTTTQQKFQVRLLTSLTSEPDPRHRIRITTKFADILKQWSLPLLSDVFLEEYAPRVLVSSIQFARFRYVAEVLGQGMWLANQLVKIVGEDCGEEG
jgi:hypothetical protein